MPKRRKKIPLREFRAWLQGVEELQTADWHPNAEQWKLIREKINCIMEEEPKVVEKVVERQAPAQTYRQPAQLPPAPPQRDAFGVEANAFAPQPMGPAPSAFEMGANADITPAAAAALRGQLPTGEVSADPVQATQAIKTPSIDTSQKDYSSGFE